MTITQFLDYLDPGDWRLDDDGNLMDGNDHCPLWHVYERHFYRDEDGEVECYVAAGRFCGLRTRDAIAIAQAADNRGHPRLRKRLLAHVGLNEPAITKESTLTQPTGDE